ncbi:hypothetical protein [Acanthopleuribacter pedis]|uniref:Uncharacterized protein n=1 Tax=Acanthopleuribacter pedis TaxID=442870 RepID=A0A8J7Q4D8_9BACT|nr:hypothetical protein [Acanthopleuribacter pedis]MBO1318960.1 hypothetical protein [Acanthopleuribacter pedis]
MIDAIRFAGYLTSSAIFNLYNQRNISPTLAYADGSGKMGREDLDDEDPNQALERGRKKLAAGAEGLAHAVFIYEGDYNFDDDQGDAIFCEVRTYGEAAAALFMAVPYRRAEKFQVFRPKFLAVEHIEQKDLPTLSHGFFEGIESNEDGATIWHASFSL